MSLKVTGDPTIHFSTRSWSVNYPVLAFLMNGQLYAEYARVTGTLGLYDSFPSLFTSLYNTVGLGSCSSKHWRNTIEWLEGYVTRLAERHHVRQSVMIFRGVVMLISGWPHTMGFTSPEATTLTTHLPPFTTMPLGKLHGLHTAQNEESNTIGMGHRLALREICLTKCSGRPKKLVSMSRKL